MSLETPLAVDLWRRARAALVRRRRRRERSCIRCGAPAAGVCPACGARVCADCSVLSIETGSAVALCRGCAGGAAAPRRRRAAPWLAFRRGAALLAFLIGGAALLELGRDGWGGAARVVLVVLHPAVLLGLVPLALVLGAAVSALLRILPGRES